MEKIKKYKKEIIFHLLLNFLVAICISLSSYIHIPLGNAKGFFVYLFHFLILQFTIFGFVYIFSLFKNIFSLFFPVLFVTLSMLSFWVYTQGISIEDSIIHAIVETKLDIAVDILSIPFLMFTLFSLGIAIIVIKQFRKLKNNSLTSPLFFVAIFAILSFFLVESYKFGTLKRKLPYSIFIAFKNYLEKPKIQLEEIENPLISKKEDLHIVFVLGESVRADHLFLNGYYRNTTPLLNHQKNIISLKNIYTPLTYTAISVPQILTNKSIVDSTKTSFYSLYSILNKSSFSSEWIGNQTLEKSYANIVNTNKKVTIIDQFHSVLSFNKEKDNKLLNFFEIDDFTNKNKISTFHMIGSHWYYNSRFTKEFQKFSPITNSKYVGSLSKEQLINSYDNTIVYLDFFLNSLIEKLKKSSKKTILIYLSDHGEILGENGQWFHAQKNKASENPAMLVWFSENFKTNNPKTIENLINNKDKNYTTDFLFHSILSVSEIEGFKYDKKKSIFYKQ